MTNQAVFTRGSTMRHVLNMTAASALGLLTMFGVDMVDMYFLSMLGEQELAAAVGFAGTIIFFLVSVSIGLQIALGALVARAEGAHRRDLARRYCTSALLFSFLASVVISCIGWLYLEELLRLLGASGLTLEYALAYAGILLPNMPILVLGMSCAAGVRAVGDARRSMWATIIGSLVNAILDPIFIFALDWGLEGAAWASAVSRMVVFAVAWHALHRVHGLPRRISRTEFVADLRPILAIATPAILTNLATPIGGGFVLRIMSQFGDSAVAGAAIMGRITPVAFCAIFALSSAVGPIIGQNAGAVRYDRVRSTLRDAMKFNFAYTLVVWLLLWLAADFIVAAFSATGPAADLIGFYCRGLTWAFAFNGILFVANASFNNLHHPHWATGFNFGRALLGTIPAVYFGAQWYGARGVMAGEAMGSLLFGVCAVLAAFYLVGRLEREHVPLAVTGRAEASEVERPPPV
ncbi:MATE family efflux transporter [Mangrovimicrobium sediminis]|uniref:MATE family efflux transporter n=1 Tax=Mangrovimicrobium sediminis TaxID=2562682 RepID=A0A4Z0M7G1_9GAMM|nr:MATE family efflux transporter [Haliea sp. SAOS-164]TGD75439.1 MATE family efflux transporter [Haliea sp. SAOS-164]